MDAGTHIFVGIVAASSWPGLSLGQRILAVFFSFLPDFFELLNYYKLKKFNAVERYNIREYIKLVKNFKNLFSFFYNFFHNIFTPLIFFVISLIFNWSLIFSLMWFLHLLMDLPSHKNGRGLKLWWPFSQHRLNGFFEWWEVKFFRDKEIFGYWTILIIISLIIIRNFW